MVMHFLVSLKRFLIGSLFVRDFFIYLWDLRRQNFEGESGDRNGVHAARRPPDNADRNFVGGDGGEGIVGADQINIRNAEDVAALLEVLAAQLEDHIEQMFGDMFVLIWGLCFIYLKIHFL